MYWPSQKSAPSGASQATSQPPWRLAEQSSEQSKFESVSQVPLHEPWHLALQSAVPGTTLHWLSQSVSHMAAQYERQPAWSGSPSQRAVMRASQSAVHEAWQLNLGGSALHLASQLPWHEAAKIMPVRCQNRYGRETESAAYGRYLALNTAEPDDPRLPALRSLIERLVQAQGATITRFGIFEQEDLIKHNLIDEYHFFVNPAGVSEGMTVFREPGAKKRLKLLETKPFECGIVVLTYAPAE